MADVNQASEELAAAMARAQREIDLFGSTTKATRDAITDAEMKAKYGMESFTKGVNSGADAIFSLASAGMAASKAMLDGKKGSAAFNSSLDDLSKAATAAGVALTFLIPGGPLIKGVIAAFTAVTTATLAYAKQANEMADKLYKGYSDLAKSGAAASDGMTGLFQDAKKLGLSMNELDGFVGVVAENSKELALFGGSVFEGRKKLADMGGALESNRENFLKMGLSMTDVTEGMTSYIRAQRVMGQTNKMTTDQLAEGAKKYLYEQDALTKLTGMTRKEQEAAREEIRSQERFAAQLEELRQQGREKEAKALEDTYLVLRSKSKDAAQGFADVATGFVGTEAAQKSFMATQGESMRIAEQVKTGQLSAAQAAQSVAKAHGDTATQLGTTMGKIGTFDSTFGSLADSLKLRGMAEADVNKVLAQIEEDRKKREGEAGKKGDELLDNQAKLIKTQIDANKALEEFIFRGIGPAQKASILMAGATENTGTALNKLADTVSALTDKIQGLLGFFGFGEPKRETTREEVEADKRAAAAKLEFEKSMEGAGTAAKLFGIGLSVEQKRKKQEYQDALENAKMLKENLDAQHKVKIQSKKETAPAAGAQPGGPQPAVPAAAPGAAGGQGAAAAPAGPAPAAPAAAPAAAPSTVKPQAQPPEGQVGQETGLNADKLLKFTERTGSKTAFDSLDNTFKNAVLRAAEEYNAVTGKQIQINSARRDPKDQERLYAETVAAGRPGIGPTGDKVAKPGRSLHEQGLAVDIQQYADPLAVMAFNRQGLFQKVPNDKVHFQARDGGVFTGPESGYKPDIEMHGTEAIIPLKNGAVPVTLNLSEALKGPAFGGVNEYAGYNMGPMSTDLDAVKKIAESVGAFDKMSQTITDPATWKQILSSGLATNYNVGPATIGTKGIPGLDDALADRLKEIKEQTGDVTSQDALKQVADEFKGVVAQLQQKLMETDAQRNANEGSSLTGLLQELISATKNGVDVQQKILASSY